MKALYLKNLRCFAEPGWIQLAPVTLLVGENSSGKTTFLAAARLAWDLANQYRGDFDFNEDPFRLGAFEQLAHYKGGRGGRAKAFELGIQQLEEIFRDKGPERILVETQGTFSSLEAQPRLVAWNQVCGEDRVRVELTHPMAETGSLLWEYQSGTRRQERTEPSFGYLPRPILLSKYWSRDIQDPQSTIFSPRRPLMRSERPFAFAPIRSQPERTFDRKMSAAQPSGAHVPMLLAQFDGQKKWLPLRRALDDFGQSSGLFQKLEVKQLGKSKSSPFQIQLKLSGPAVNLIDVGYGVSQALPLVFDILRAPKDQIFLLQQPEVHLHPRAQAAFGSLLLQLAKSTGKQFLVETHSDHIVDRVRMDVRDQKGLTPDDVVILYFEREGTEVKIHPIRVDKQGNLIGVPPGYRRFFLEEERRFLMG